MIVKFGQPLRFDLTAGTLQPVNTDSRDGYARQMGKLELIDTQGNGIIEKGHRLNHFNPEVRKDPISNIQEAPILRSGTIKGVLAPTGKVVIWDAIVVEQDGVQYVLFPDAPPGLIDKLTRIDTSGLVIPPNPVVPPCFTAGTLIWTDRGEVAVENLQPGDLVMTRDNDLQPLRWIGGKQLDAVDLAARPNLRPIRIKAGALGAGTPERDLLVSPQHRVLVRSAIAQKMFGTPEVLVAAKQLVLLDGVDIADDVDSVHYIHLLFDRHEILVSNGAQTESLYTGPEALKGVGAAARAEIAALFPQLLEEGFDPASARPLVSGRMGRKMAQRHHQNGKALVA